jgi:hypothetical protein
MGFERDLLIEKLVTTAHLNVPERLALGSDPVNASEVAAVIIAVLNKTGTFPETAKPWSEGHIVDERIILQRLPEGKVRMIQQRGHAVDPARLAEQKVTDFDDIVSAVESLMKIEWSIGIDGIPVHFPAGS